MTKLYIASDHAGLEAKNLLKARFPDIEWVDFGPQTKDSVHYPDFAHKLCQNLLDENTGNSLLEPKAVLICGSGVGMSLTANRYPGVRAVLAHRADIAKASREHNASNILCLGGRFNSTEEINTIFDQWLNTAFEGGRHLKRIEMIEEKK
jgi:ribose 5-phosphate isomerase B